MSKGGAKGQKELQSKLAVRYYDAYTLTIQNNIDEKIIIVTCDKCKLEQADFPHTNCIKCGYDTGMAVDVA